MYVHWAVMAIREGSNLMSGVQWLFDSSASIIIEVTGGPQGERPNVKTGETT